MTRRDEINKLYFEYLCDFVVPLGIDMDSEFGWGKTLQLMNNKEYTWVLKMDENRACDGMALRWRFILDNPVYEQYIDLLDGPCSVLEMLVALALRCEETIMDNPEYGNRTATWFWHMIVNLGLNGNHNRGFNRRRVEERLDRWMANDYEPNGKGGLFTLKHCDKDLREIEIWVQLNWYLNESYF